MNLVGEGEGEPSTQISSVDQASVGRTSVGRTLRWGYLGRMPWAEAFALQRWLRQRLKEGKGEEHLLLLEHDPVFTLGRSADGGDVLADEAWLRGHGVTVEATDRGGQVTYHGPGQLVGYPILNLSPDRRDIRRYVRDLQEILVDTLESYNIVAHPGEGKERIGVWVGDRKIASIGVHLSRWLTTHGFALNVSTDLDFFRSIVACGLPAVEMTSILRERGQDPPLAQVARRFQQRFEERFQRRAAALSPQDISALRQRASALCS